MTYTSRFGNLTVVDEPVYKSELYEAPASNLSSILTSSTQFNKTLGANVPLVTGSVANGCTFFDPVADKDADGTTSYNEIPIAYGIDLTLTGTSGTANIGIDTGSGIVNYLATFNTDLPTTTVPVASGKVTVWFCEEGLIVVKVVVYVPLSKSK